MRCDAYNTTHPSTVASPHNKVKTKEAIASSTGRERKRWIPQKSGKQRGGIEGIPLPRKEPTETTEIGKSGLALYTTFIEQKRILLLLRVLSKPLSTSAKR